MTIVAVRDDQGVGLFCFDPSFHDGLLQCPGVRHPDLGPGPGCQPSKGLDIPVSNIILSIGISRSTARFSSVFSEQPFIPMYSPTSSNARASSRDPADVRVAAKQAGVEAIKMKHKLRRVLPCNQIQYSNRPTRTCV